MAASCERDISVGSLSRETNLENVGRSSGSIFQQSCMRSYLQLQSELILKLSSRIAPEL